MNGPVCEIGVHHGRSFILLHLLTTDAERSIAWDLFENQEQNIDRSGRGNKDTFVANLRRHGCDLPRIEIRTRNSLELSPIEVVRTCGAPPRIFSIDGGHTAAITHSDLRLAAQSIRPDGLIILDDFFNESWPGVAEGTCRYFADPVVPLLPVGIGGNKCLFTIDPDMARAYRSVLLPAPLYGRRDTTLFGEPVPVFTALSLKARVFRKPVVKRIRKSVVWRAARHLRRAI
jgi:hypothetical protein